MKYFVVPFVVMGFYIQCTLTLECYNGTIAVQPVTNQTTGVTRYYRNTCELSTTTCSPDNSCESWEITDPTQIRFYYYCVSAPTTHVSQVICSCNTALCNLPAVDVGDCGQDWFESIRSCSDPTTTSATTTTTTTTTITTTTTSTTTTATEPSTTITSSTSATVTPKPSVTNVSSVSSNATTTSGGLSLKACLSLVLLAVMFACGIS